LRSFHFQPLNSFLLKSYFLLLCGFGLFYFCNVNCYFILFVEFTNCFVSVVFFCKRIQNFDSAFTPSCTSRIFANCPFYKFFCKRLSFLLSFNLCRFSPLHLNELIVNSFLVSIFFRFYLTFSLHCPLFDLFFKLHLFTFYFSLFFCLLLDLFLQLLHLHLLSFFNFWIRHF